MATNRMSGNLLGVKLGGQFIDCEMSCELNFENDLLPASPIDEGRWKSYIDGVRSWNVAVNAGTLMRMSGTGFNTILNWFINGGLMEVSIETKAQDIYPSLVISGNVRLRNGGLSASVNTLSTWNTTLEGDGPMVASVNSNVVFAISANEEENEVLQDGNNSIVVGENNNNN